MHQIAVDESGKCQGDEQGTGHGIELPALRRNLSGALFDQQRQRTHQKVQQQQFERTRKEWFALVCPRADHQPTVIDKGRLAATRAAKITSQMAAVWVMG